MDKSKDRREWRNSWMVCILVTCHPDLRYLTVVSYVAMGTIIAD